jgi:hypothetical protein
MNDPTYVRSEIDANPEWQLAFTISEIENDNAPIGWSKYIGLAKCLLDNYSIQRKDTNENGKDGRLAAALQTAHRDALVEAVMVVRSIQGPTTTKEIADAIMRRCK